MDSLDLLKTAASGMDAQRSVLDVAARNVAAAQAAGPTETFARLVPDLRVRSDGDAPFVEFVGTHAQRGTNVDALTEMIAVMNASRSYEADVSLFDVGKTLAEKTLEMGRL